MAAFGGLGDMLGISGGGFSNALVSFYILAPIVVYAVIAVGSVFFAIWFMKFKYVVYVHTQRSNGKIIIRKTKGGFFTNRRTKVERLNIFSDLKAIIPPPPERFIIREGRKDIIHLMRTSGKEYIPMAVLREDKYLEAEHAIRCKTCKKDYLIEDEDIKACPECKGEKIEKIKLLVEKTNFQVHSEQAKDWFEIATNEDERKYRIGNWMMENQTIIIAITWGAVFLMSVMFIMGQVENAINMGGAVVTTCTEQIARGGLLIPLALLRRKKNV